MPRSRNTDLAGSSFLAQNFRNDANFPKINLFRDLVTCRKIENFKILKIWDPEFSFFEMSEKWKEIETSGPCSLEPESRLWAVAADRSMLRSEKVMRMHETSVFRVPGPASRGSKIIKFRHFVLCPQSYVGAAQSCLRRLLGIWEGRISPQECKFRAITNAKKY